jgi:hypothetical protein
VHLRPQLVARMCAALGALGGVVHHRHERHAREKLQRAVM